jgi:hypothetical protein
MKMPRGAEEAVGAVCHQPRCCSHMLEASSAQCDGAAQQPPSGAASGTADVRSLASAMPKWGMECVVALCAHGVLAAVPLGLFRRAPGPAPAGSSVAGAREAASAKDRKAGCFDLVV